MAITYPLLLPAVKDIKTINFRSVNTVGISTSPFTYAQQVYQYTGQKWEAEVTLPSMKRANAEEWISFLVKLKGKYGTFLMGDPNGETPRGSASSTAGTPVVNGASQTGSSLAIDGLPASATGYLKVGDYISLGSGTSTRLYKVLDDADSNSSGEVTLEIFPDLRVSPADGDAVTVSSAKGTWRLNSNETQWSIDVIAVYGLTFACEEAL